MEIELHPGLPDGLHAAFEDGVLGGIGITGDDFKYSEDNRENDHNKGKKYDDDEKQPD